MPELTQDDIALGRLALQQGALTRPQLDAAVALVRSGQATDLARGLLRTGMTVGQLEQLRVQSLAGTRRPPPPSPVPAQRSEALTVHDDAEVTVGLTAPGLKQGAYGGQPPQQGYYAPPPSGSAYGLPPVAPRGFAPGPGFPPSPASAGFGAPPGYTPAPASTGFGAPPGYTPAPAYPAGGGFGAGPGPGGTHAGPGSTNPGPGGTHAGPGATHGYGSNTGGGGFGTAPGGDFGASPAAGPELGGFGASPAAPQTNVQDKVGPWVIEREIARGGMGAIYLGKHESTNERAAVKVMLLGEAGASEKKVKRFLREIEANKKLIHPGIVRILDAGEWGGYPYFAMEFVEGKPLDRMLKDDLDLEIGMEIIEAMARAVHHAHENGIIHRDLKPANVIVQEDMQPKLTDFGLAKNTENQSVLTKTGAVIGTPYYLSPEQASGKSKDIDARADIYALGVIMYELATGRLPFVGQTTVELYNRIIHDDPVPPTKVKPQLTKAFETVCMRAMAKSPDERYPTAAAFADDVQALLQGGTVAARADGVVALALRRLKRKGTVPVILGASSAALLVVVGLIVAFFHHQRTESDWRMQQTELADFTGGLDRRIATAREDVTRGSAALSAARVPDALSAAGHGLEALDGFDKALAEIKLPENQQVAAERKAERDELARAARATALVLRARATMLAGEPDALTQAQDDLRTVIDGVRPDDVAALLAQGDLHVLSGKLNEALDQYRATIDKGQEAIKASQERARTLLTGAETLPPLLERLAGSPALAPVELARGHAEANRAGDAVAALEEAVRLLRARLAELPPTSRSDKTERDAVEALAVKADTALFEYRDAEERAQDIMRAHRGRARTLFLLESFPDAIPVLTGAIEGLATPGAAVAGDPGAERARLLVERARTYLEMGELEKARQDSLEAAKSPKADWSARASLGEALMRMGDRFAARDAFAEALAAAGEQQAGPLVARAEALLAAGFHAEALEDARAAVELDPGSLLALVVKAEAEEALLHLTDAQRDAEAVALRTHPRDWRLHARAERVVARVAATTGNIKEAHDHAKKAYGLDEASSVGRLLLATIELDPSFEDQYLDGAENLFKLVLRQRPRSIEATRGLGLVTLAKHARNPDRAQRKLEEAYEADPRDPWTMAALAHVFEDRGNSDKSRLLRLRASRFERDVRRREGLYFAYGLREQRRARELQGAMQSQHLELARDAYRRAAWLDPLHSQALTGLASITHFQGARTSTEAYLKRALLVNPGSVQALVLDAYHSSSRDIRDREPLKVLEKVLAALAKRGETLDLVALRALLTVREQPDAVKGETLATKVDLMIQRFDELRRRSPFALESYRHEREMTTAVIATLAEADPLRMRLQERDELLRRRQSALGQDMDDRERLAEELRQKAEQSLNSNDAPGALEHAQQSTRKAPWAADGWSMLARCRARNGDVWGALAAGIRAAHTDDRHAVTLFELLRSASRVTDGDLAQVAERIVAMDRDALPFDVELETVLRAAPRVTRALVARLDVEVGKGTAEALETLVNNDPTLIAPQVLLGVLAYGADQDELAVQNLLFVATVRDDAGEAYYLAAVVLASQQSATDADLVQAAEWLQASTFAGFRWKDKATNEPRLKRLRESPLWERLVEVGGD